MPKGIPIFYSKTLVNTEKMLESTDFACTLKETKTTIPISRTPKPISEFGLKPGKYRPSAVKVAGFDPLDANHAASTGVRSLPVLDRTCKTDPGGGVPVPGDNTPRIIDDRAGKSYRNRRPGPDHRGLPNMVMGGSRRDSPRPRKGTQ